MTKTHWNRHDYRIVSLTLTIQGLEKSLDETYKKLKRISWYDGLWLLEESEPIIGLAFIALQNYINSSIYDRYQTLKNKSEKYKLGTLFEKFGRTDIELIIAIANYFKHRDDDQSLHKATQKILEECNLQFDNEVDITNSPILVGLGFFTKTNKLTDLINNVAKWRENLWSESDI